MNKKTKKDIKDGIIDAIIALIILAVVIAIIGIIIHFTIPPPTPTSTTYILSKFYPLTGYYGNATVLFYTNTSPVGCISYAIVKKYNYNVTSQGLYLANETKTTEVATLYNNVGNSYLAGSNQQELFMTENGTNDKYIIILQNQTLLCK